MEDYKWPNWCSMRIGKGVSSLGGDRPNDLPESASKAPGLRRRLQVLEQIDMMGYRRTCILLGFLVLVMFCSPGDALRCYDCNVPTQHCTKNITCRTEDDACLRVMTGTDYRYLCWKYANCNMEKIGEILGIAKATYHCCQEDLCNDAGMGATISKTTMISGLLAVMLWGFYV
uniref:CD59 glycoprotein n=1 Tax=Monodelphis domestica TaxID=13616 RepID=A0A5F8GVS5_MONDO